MHLCAVFFVLVATSILAQTVEILPSQDNTLFQYAVPYSDGSGPHVYVGRSNSQGGFSARRGLIRFDVAASVPPGHAVISATLTLNASSSNGNPTTVSLHRLTSAWGEGASNSGSPGGSGAPAAVNDATWTDAFYPTVPWTTPGGDFAPAPVASFPATTAGVYFIGPSAALTADVQDQLSNPGLNFGWLLKTNETPGVTKRFDSRENVGFEPRLSITYALAAPALATTIGVGCAAGGGPAFRLAATQPPSLGAAAFALVFSSGPGSGASFLYLAPTAAANPLSLPGGCSVYLDMASAWALVFAGASPLGPFALDPAGVGTVPFPVPLDPGLAGFSVVIQALVFDGAAAAGFVLSNALLLVVGI